MYVGVWVWVGGKERGWEGRAGLRNFLSRPSGAPFRNSFAT